MDKDIMLALMFLVAAEDRRRLEEITNRNQAQEARLQESIKVCRFTRKELFENFRAMTGRKKP